MVQTVLGHVHVRNTNKQTTFLETCGGKSKSGDVIVDETKGGFNVLQSVSKKLVHFASKTPLFNTNCIKQCRLTCKVHKFLAGNQLYDS